MEILFLATILSFPIEEFERCYDISIEIEYIPDSSIVPI